MTPFSPMPGLVMEESGAPTAGLTLWLPGLRLGAGVGKAGLGSSGKAEVKVVSKIINYALGVRLLEGDDTARWKQSWLGKPHVSPLQDLFPWSSTIRVQKDLPGLGVECHVSSKGTLVQGVKKEKARLGKISSDGRHQFLRLGTLLSLPRYFECRLMDESTQKELSEGDRSESAEPGL